jgi:hypothetical protein
MENEAQLTELFSLAQKKNEHRSLGSLVSTTFIPTEQDIATVTDRLKAQDAEQSFNQDMLNYSYGL